MNAWKPKAKAKTSLLVEGFTTAAVEQPEPTLEVVLPVSETPMGDFGAKKSIWNVIFGE